MTDSTTDRPVTVALPNKGRLAEQALDLFEQAGLRPAFRAERALVAGLGTDFQAIFVRAADIPEYVADGAAEVGVTGRDLVAESGREVVEVLDLEYGRCRLVVAALDDAPIESAADVAPGSRVATAFPRTAAAHFASVGVPVEVAAVSGATEIAPHLGVADVIVDLTSTGSTLRVHGLREVETILESSARLWANPRALENASTGRVVEELSAALESVLRAAGKRYLMANVPRSRLEEVQRVIPGLSGPTIVEILDSGQWVAAHAVVEADRVYQTIGRLKELGAEGILVTRIERLMP